MTKLSVPLIPCLTAVYYLLCRVHVVHIMNVFRERTGFMLFLFLRESGTDRSVKSCDRRRVGNDMTFGKNDVSRPHTSVSIHSS